MDFTSMVRLAVMIIIKITVPASMESAIDLWLFQSLKKLILRLLNTWVNNHVKNIGNKIANENPYRADEDDA